ncbi:MAG: DNA polymerase II [Opitutae bacterium]|nr:DNA polymerase II [Opitutae bacterium]
MKTMEPETKEQGAIDLSRYSKEKRQALEVTEEARGPRLMEGFASGLFLGSPKFSPLYEVIKEESPDGKEGDKFLETLERTLDRHANPDEIDETGEIPDSLLEKLAEIGAFGIKIPKEYGGLGLSQATYSRAAKLLGSRCGNLTALLSAHQSIGLPQPLLRYGTEDQKKKFLPDVARGAITAFALTEDEVGSDPSRLNTRAKPIKGGKSYLINGQKLWCTNGTKAKYLVVMARTPSTTGAGGKRKRSITAFVVDARTPGIEIAHRCRFMGLRALYNGVIRFHNVEVPAKNIILAPGKGMRVALNALGVGRLTLPAACSGLAYESLKIARCWCVERRQWGSEIGKHEAIASKLADMAADAYATDSMVRMTSALVDAKVDFRMESALCKLWGTETAWRVVDDLMQIRGGRGYETARSLANRGDNPEPVERMMRDSRINRIFEGSTEIMRLYLAREALDPHLRLAGGAMDSRLSLGTRLLTAIKAGIHYSIWYPGQYLPSLDTSPSGTSRRTRKALRYVERTSRRLSRSLFHAMALHGPALEKRQLLLGRLVDVAGELFALTSSHLRADAILAGKEACEEIKKEDLPTILAYLDARTRNRVRGLFEELSNPADGKGRRLASKILAD